MCRTFRYLVVYRRTVCRLFYLPAAELSTVMIHRVWVFSIAVNIVVNLSYDSIVGQKFEFLKLYDFTIFVEFVFSICLICFSMEDAQKTKLPAPFTIPISTKLFVHDTFHNTLCP